MSRKKKPTINPRYKPKDRYSHDGEAVARFADGASSGLICIYRDSQTLKVEVTNATDDVEVVAPDWIDPDSVKEVAEKLGVLAKALDHRKSFGVWPADFPPLGSNFEDCASEVVDEAIGRLELLVIGG